MNQTTFDIEREQSEKFAKSIMAMNRHDRRAFAKKNRLDVIYGSNKPIINEEKRRMKS